MKKLSFVLLALVAAVCFVSCGDSPDRLEPSRAKKLAKKELLRTHGNESSATVSVGYYECNDNDDRLKLRQLAANDIVSYSCEIVKKMERVKKTRRVQAGYYYRYWTTESYWVDEEVNTFFVKVALTEKGQKLVFEEKEAEPSEDEKDLKKDKEIDLSKFPEFTVEETEFPQLAKKAEQAEVTEGDEDGVMDDEMYAEEDAAAQNQSAYDKAKAKETIEKVELKAFELKVVKAINVRTLENGTGKATILMEYTDVTPVGRIMLDRYNGQRFTIDDLNFAYYEDKGWRWISGE